MAYISKQASENKPLIEYCSSGYAKKYELEYRTFKPCTDFDLYVTRRGAPIGEVPQIVFGITARPEEFTKYDFLMGWDTSAFIVHGRVVEVFSEMCPEDFQAFNVEIHNFDPKGEQFVNKEFYLINVLHRIRAIDEEKSIIQDWGDNYFNVAKKVFKEDGMQGHLLARDDLTGQIIFHPKLAKKFRKSKGIQFLSDEESPR